MSRAGRPPRDRDGLPEVYHVEWPGGPYDFELVPVLHIDPVVPTEHRPGWFDVTGLCVRPEGVQHRTIRTLFAEQVGPDRFRMLPARG